MTVRCGCPGVDEWRRFLTGALANLEAAPLEEHLRECADCFQAVESLEIRDTLTDALRAEIGAVDPLLSQALAAELMRKLKEWRPADTPPVPEQPTNPLPASDLRTVDAPEKWPTIPGYEIQGELGRGGMGVVYQAWHARLRRVVALKMLLAGEHAGPKQLARFQIEAEAAARLQHPNIVQIHEVGDHAGCSYFTLEFVEGPALAAKLAGAPQPARHAAQLVEVLARATHYAHQRGILHRDLKPANVLLARSDPIHGVLLGNSCDESEHYQPKITDFGLAKLMLEGRQGQTGTGEILGTPSYMAPEQTGGKPAGIGPAADVYALGAILYELLTGRPPFRGESTWDTVQQVITADPVPPSRLQPKMPRDLETICLKCLRKEPGKRYVSAEVLAEDLRRYLDGRPIEARPVGTSERLWQWCRRNPALATFAGLAATALLGMVAFAIAFAFQQASAARAIGLEQDKTLAALRRAEQTNSDRSRDLGLTLCGQGEVASGLLWLARALQIAPDQDGDAARAIRLNLAAWHPRTRVLRAILPNPNPAGDERTLGQMLAYSPDGATLAGACVKLEIVLLWDTATGRLRGEPLRHFGFVDCLAFHRDGTLATGCRDGKIRFWDVAAGTLIREPLDTGGWVTGLAFSPDGRTLVTCRGDPEIRFWDVGPDKSLSQRVMVSAGHKAEVHCLSCDGRFFVILDGKRTGVQVGATATGQPVGPSVLHPLSVETMALSPDGKTVVTTMKMGGAWVWEAATGIRRFELSNLGHLNRVLFAPNGQTILTAGTDSTVRLWNAATGQPLGPTVQLSSPVWGTAFSPDGTTFATSGGPGETVLVWETDLRSDRVLITSHLVGTVRFSPDGRQLLTGGMVVNLPFSGTRDTGGLDAIFRSGVKLLRTGQVYEGEAQLWDAATFIPQGTRLSYPNPVLSAAFSPDGTQCLIGCADLVNAQKGEAKLWDVATGRQIAKAPHGDNVGIPAVAFSPDGRTYLTGGIQDRQARLWDAATGECLRSFGHRKGLRGMAYKPGDCRTILTGSDDRTAQLWDAGTGEKRGERLQHPAEVTSVAFSRDGKYVLTGCQDNLARIWDQDTREVVQSFAHRGWVLAAVFSPDGSLVLTGSADGTARVWDRATGLQVGPPVQHDKAVIPGLQINMVPAVAFSPDGQTLVSGGTDQKVRFRAVPQALEGKPERIMLWVEVTTGMTLLGDAIHFLDADQWQERRQRLDQLGGPPVLPSARSLRAGPRS